MNKNISDSSTSNFTLEERPADVSYFRRSESRSVLEGGDDDDSEVSDEVTGALITSSVPVRDFTARETGRLQGCKDTILGYFVFCSGAIGFSLYYLIVDSYPYTKLINVSLESFANFTVTGQECFAFCYTVLMLIHYSLFRRYDTLVHARQKKLLKETQRSHTFVTSLFPEEVTRRLMVEEGDVPHEDTRTSIASRRSSDQIQAFLDQSTKELLIEERKGLPQGSKPIADFFPMVTIMFCDLVGFTAWSSTREPSLVFTLLESIYCEFDRMARRQGVFKIETIGDCYVAVCGLPQPRDDHAVVMARFASHCQAKFKSVVLDLEKVLGPDTADLKTRTGLHSGPVTAGVLRGDRARFQLFGDTMNTTSRIETTGQGGKIHLSKATADLLIMAGKTHWLEPREDKVLAKGKGEMSTFWLISTKNQARRNSLCSVGSQSSIESIQVKMNFSIPAKHLRLVDWIAAELAALLRDLERSRKAKEAVPADPDILALLERKTLLSTALPTDEIVEVIALPEFQEDSQLVDPEEVVLEDQVLAELHDYVMAIAQAYPLVNPFHNFEHASHVTMSCCKLFSRIVPRDLALVQDPEAAYELHKQTFGISSDPLSRFSVVLSALIHDVGHPGVPNFILIQENHPLAERYKTSPAEQNSIDFSWQLLQQERFSNLRAMIYTTPEEFQRFRQILTNVVMSTDIMTKDLTNERESRWERAFSKGEEQLKSTIILEHIIQASDIAHTMQHWHVYRKWNGRLLEEMNKAYQEGRTPNDPSNRWYEGEIGFFDGHVLPLAKKLNLSGVFGVSGQEYLNYANMNKEEWTLFGQGVVSGIIDTMQQSAVRPIKAHVSRSPSMGSFRSPRRRRLKSLKEKLESSQSNLPPVLLPMMEVDEVELPKTLSVLLVDDDKIFRKLFTRAVQMIAPEWTIWEADSGEQAMHIFSAQGSSSIDLIFMDYFLSTDSSHMLGSQTVAQLRKCGLQETIICGMSSRDCEDIFLDAGADIFCFKPWKFNAEALKSELGRLLSTVKACDGGSSAPLSASLNAMYMAMHSP